MRTTLASLLCGVLLVPAGVVAQSADRTVSGLVEDPSGGTIPGAEVTIACGGEVRTVTASASGTFEILGLPATTCAATGVSEHFDAATVTIDLTSRGSAYLRLVLPIKGFESEVVVTPGRGGQEQSFDIPESVAVTTREELESRPHQILPQVLREEPGVLVQQTTTAQGSPFIRGFSAQRVLYLLDGVRFNTAIVRSGATQYLGWINPGLVERMEVLRGPASVQYGSDALGGTINVLSIDPPFSPAGTKVSGAVEAVVGSADLSVGVDAAALIQTPSAAIRLGGATRRLQDLRPGRGRDSHAAVARFLGLPSTVLDDRLPDTGFTQAGGHLSARMKAGATGALHLLYLHEEQADVTRFDRTLGGDGLFRSEFDPQRLDFALVRYGRGDTGPFDRASFTFSLNRQRDDRLEQARPATRIEQDELLVNAFGYQGQASRLVANQHHVVFGGELYDEYITTARTFTESTGLVRNLRPEIPDDTRYVSLGAFAQDVWQVHSRLSVRGGLRVGRFAFETTSNPALGVEEERVTSSALTFHSGAVIGLSDRANVTLTASRGFRAANALDLGAIGISGGGFEISPARAAALGAEIGNNDGSDAVTTGSPVSGLSPESLYAFEAGLKIRTAKIAASLTAFDFELRDLIQRRTAIFTTAITGTNIAGYDVVAQDAAGRAYVAADPRPIVTRVNVDRARVRGVEVDGTVRFTPAWLATAYFSMTNGRDLVTGEPLRRMPPPLGGVRLKWEPGTRSFWMEGVATFAAAQTRLSAGDLSDPRVGGRRTAGSIASFFSGTATDLGLVREGILVRTGETLTQVQQRLLDGAASSFLYTRTPGFLNLGMRGGWRAGPRVAFTVIADNLTDRNYRWHGSGVDAPGFNLQVRTRVGF